MKAKTRSTAPVTVHALLTALALLVAYATWTRDRTQVQQSESAIALDLNKRDITSIVYEDENRAVTMERRTTPDGDPYAWVTVRSHSKQLVTNPVSPPPSPHGAPPPVPAAPGAHPGSPLPNPHAPPTAVPPPPGARPGPVGARPPVPPPGRPIPAQGVPGKAPAKGGDKAAANKDKPTAVPPPPVPAPQAAAPAKPGTPPAAAGAPTPPAAAASTPPAPAPIHEVKETVTTKSFRGNDQADKLFDLFAPMRVTRSLGTIDDKKAKELGLDVSKKSLTINAKGQAVKFTIGINSYGSGDVYARDPQGQVYLLGHKQVSDFEFAESRLMERRLHRFERPDFDRIEVQVTSATGVKSRTLLQKNRQDAANFYFVDSTTSDKRDDTLRNWVDKILRMAINDYVNQGEEPKANGPVSGSPMIGDVLTLRFFDGKKNLGEAVYSRYPNKSGQNEYFAHTETTMGLVRLLNATAESAIQDAEKW